MNSVVPATIIPSCQPIRGRAVTHVTNQRQGLGSTECHIWVIKCEVLIKHCTGPAMLSPLTSVSPHPHLNKLLFIASSLSWLWHQVSRILVFSKVEKVNSLQQLCSSLPSINSMGPIQCWDLWFFLFIFHQIYLSPLPQYKYPAYLWQWT